MGLQASIDRLISFSRAAIRISMVISALSLVVSSVLIIVYQDFAFDYYSSYPATVVFSAMIIAFWSVVYTIIALGVIFLYNYLRNAASWHFIKTELIYLCMTILSSVLFILTVLYYKPF